MTSLHITPADRTNVFVFLIELPEDDAASFANDSAAIGHALDTVIDATHVVQFPLSDLEGVGLTEYLIEGMGLSEGAVEADVLKLDALRGHVLILKGSAFMGETLDTLARPPLLHVGTYPETGAPVLLEPLKSEAAKGQLSQGKPPKSEARISGMIAFYVLLFLAFFVVLFVWLAS